MKSKSVVLKEFKQLMSLKYSKNTIENYSYYIEQFLDFSTNTALRVTNNDFLKYNIYLVKINVADATRNVAINAIKLYFSLYLKKEIKTNIAIRPSFKNKVVRQIDHNFLLDKIDNTKNLKSKLIFTFGYGSGLRSNEIIELKRVDLNLKEKFITVNGKGSKQRNLPISDNTVNLILEYGFKYRPVNYIIKRTI